MDFQFTLYIMVMLSAAVVCFLIACYTWRFRDIPVDTAIIFIMMITITEWLVASALGYATTDPASKIIWAKIEYIGVVSVPLMVFMFSVNYAGLKHRLNTRNLILIALVPAITLLLTWTNEMHGLIWSRYVPYQENGVMFSNKTYGLWFWVYWIYSYLLLLAATVLIIRTALASSKVFIAQTVVLIFGILVPWLGNAIYVLRISPLGNLDLTPLAFAFTGTMLSLGIVRWRLFNIKPTAQIAVIENMADGLILLNSYNRIIDINPAARQIFGVSTLEAIGKQGSYILPVELFSDELRNNGGKTRLEKKIPYDGSERNFEITGTPFHDKLGELMGRIVIVHDMTELKMAQEMLHVAERRHLEQKIDESEGKYRNLVENAGEGICVIQDGSLKLVNRALADTAGFSIGDMTNKLFIDFIHPEDREIILERESRRISGEKFGTTYVFRAISNEGQIRWLNLNAIMITWEDKPATLNFLTDITERKQAEEALKKSEEKYRGILEEMRDAYFEVDLKGNFTFANSTLCQALGYSYEEIIGMSYNTLVSADDIANISKKFGAVYRGVEPSAIVAYKAIRRDSSLGDVEIMVTTLKDTRGEIVGFRCLGRDITERKLAEEKLQKSYESLQKTLNDAINTMVKIVEVRDPYTAGHQQRVADLATAIAMEMKLEDTRFDQLRTAAVIHDIGKMYVSSDILSKPGKLSDIEFSLIKTHSRSGYDIVKGMDFPGVVAQTVLQHHERLDGSGYPNQLKGDDTLLEAKILAVADVIEAMASHRPYRPALGIDKALDEILKNKGRLYAPEVVDACLELFNSGRFEFKSV